MEFALQSILIWLALLAPFGFVVWALYQGKPRGAQNPLTKLLAVNPADCMLLGGTLLTLLSEMTRATLPVELSSQGLFLTIFGLLLFASGALFRARQLPKTLENALKAIAAWLGCQPGQVIWLLCALALSMLAHLAAGSAGQMRASYLPVIAWGLAMLLGLIGAWNIRETKLRIPRQDILIALALSVAAFFLRAWGNGYAPNTLTGDEASAGLFGLEILNGQFNNPFTFGWFSFPAFYFYLHAWAISLFGQTTEALRISSALAGGLSVGLLYLLGRALFDRLTGLVAAIFLSGLHLHMHFSRIGLNNIWDGFWFITVIGLLWVGWKRQARWAWLLAGLALGLAQYFYVSVRLLFVLVLAWLLLLALFERKTLRSQSASVLLMMCVVLIAFLPLLGAYIRHPDQFMAPIRRVSLLGDWLVHQQSFTGEASWQILGREIGYSLQAFTNTPLRSWYMPDTPILRPAAAAMFLLGGILLVAGWRKPQHWLVMLWIGAFVISGGLSESAPAAQRYTGVAPAAALLVALTIRELGQRLAALWPKARRAWAAAMLLGAALLALSDLNFYFNDFTWRGEYGGDNTAVAHYLAVYLQDQPDGVQVAFFGNPNMGYLSIRSLLYLAPHARGMDMTHPWGAAENPTLEPGPVVYVFLPDQQANFEAAQRDFPEAAIQLQYAMNGHLLYQMLSPDN